MGFAFSSETMVAHAYVGLAIVCLITMAMILWIVSLRLRLYFTQRHQANFQKTWLPIFTETALHPNCHKKDAVLPPLKRRDFLLFMNQWLGFQESLSGHALVRMNGLARRLKLHTHARPLLLRGKFRQRFMAIAFLGELRDRNS